LTHGDNRHPTGPEKFVLRLAQTHRETNCALVQRKWMAPLGNWRSREA